MAKTINQTIKEIDALADRERGKRVVHNSTPAEEGQSIRKTAEIVQLPLWATEKRGIPNELIRSSLFTVGNRNRVRDNLKNHNLYVIGDGVMTYTGEELRQDDEDVWMQIVHLFQNHNTKDYIEFSPYSILKALGWSQTPYYTNKLKECLARMSATGLDIYSKSRGKGINLSLVRKFQWQDDCGNRLKKWRVWVEKEVVVLFSNSLYTKVSWDQRRALSELGKWLHSYYASHKVPYPIKVVTLRDACGSKTKNIKHFKEKLRKALTQLVKVGFLTEYWIDLNNLVHVTRNLDTSHNVEV